MSNTECVICENNNSPEFTPSYVSVILLCFGYIVDYYCLIYFPITKTNLRIYFNLAFTRRTNEVFKNTERLVRFAN